jgi:hypothetical protein
MVHSLGLAQCLAPYQSISFDTLVIGNGNGTHLLNLSQFDPAMGTLISTQIHAYVSLNYGFTLENSDSIPGNFSVSVVRSDQIQSSALPITYSNIMDTAIGTYNLNPGESVSMAPYTILYRYDNSDSIYQNQVDFLGSGSVLFKYNPLTYTNLIGTNSYLYGATANDTIRFSVTYYYCSNITLSASLTHFTAQKADNWHIALEWTTDNEQRGRIYEIQKSPDGTDFTTVGRVGSGANGQIENYYFDYPTALAENGRIYFRLNIRDASGNSAYSQTRMVDLGPKNDAIFLFPNPSDQFINVLLRQPGGLDWTVEIIAADGRLIQTSRFTNTQSARIYFNQKLPPGTYFAHISGFSIKSEVMGFVVR